MGSPMRMSGLISGIDTDSIISQLVSAKRANVDKKVGEKTKLSWKQDAWKDLNKELKSLKSTVSNLRLSASYSKKVVRPSDSSKVSVLASDGAVDSVQTLKIDSLAKTAYLTGGVVSNKSDPKSKVTALTSLSDLGLSEDDISSLKLTGKQFGAEGKSLELNAGSTVSDLLTQLKGAGLNASFDEKNQRLFVSAKQSGADYDFEIGGNSNALSNLGLQVKGEDDKDPTNTMATKVKGDDAVIYLNGARFTNNTNTFSINGLTITAMGRTTGDEEISLTTERDTSGIYDSLKSFLKSYNSIINKLDKVYNADSAKDYRPLTDDEKSALTDKEVEEYEQKIKDSLFRRDETVSNIINTLTGAMSKSYEVNGKSTYLSDFGIGTLGYFLAADNERHAYHIDGDADDSDTAGKEDKLKALISSDPDRVVSFFTKLSQELYTGMNKLSSSVADKRSYGNFFEDKRIKSDIESYTNKISDMEEKVNAYEDKLYKQYSAMEKALASLQSKTNAISGLIGSAQ